MYYKFHYRILQYNFAKLYIITKHCFYYSKEMKKTKKSSQKVVKNAKTKTGPIITKRGDKNERWYCYTIATPDCGRTYVGKTNNLQRRKRQHCGEIKGGARQTRGRKWYYAFYVDGFKSERACLQFEWRCHYECRKNRKKRSGITGRVQNLIDIMNMKKWTKNSPLSKNIPLTIYWRKEFLSIVEKNREKFPSHIKHKLFKKIK